MKLSAIKTFSENNKARESDENNFLAIVGMDCVIGTEESVYGLWDSLRLKTDFVTKANLKRKKMTQDIMRLLGDDSVLETTDIQPMCFLNTLDTFDYPFFEMSSQEAMLIDPSQRLLLESAYRCLEDSNHVIGEYRGENIGIFIGYDESDLIRYKDILYRSNFDLYGLSIPGNHPAILAGRIADYFDFKGPAYVINTACSSSMSALHQACKAIRNGECEMALVSTINYTLTPVKKSNFLLGIEATKDRTKTFSDQADGTGKGEGLVSLLIKPYSQAITDKDAIYAVIRGSATTQDGKSSSLTSPNMLAQVQVLQKAWRDAGINPRELQYIEAHGTGTKIGDPIEIEAIKTAIKPFTNDRMFCAIGSIKSNIGHLNAAAGLAGVLKTALILHNKELVPNCHFEYPNAHIDFFNSPIYVCTQRRALSGETIYAGVSSFGLSGTNVHIVMSNCDHTQHDDFPDESVYKIMAISAKTPSALRKLVYEYIWHMEGLDKRQLFIYCYTVNTRRVHYPCRCIFLGRDLADIRKQMVAYLYAEEPGKSYCQEMKTNEYEYPANVQGILIKNTSKDADMLIKLCRRYIAGDDVNWNECYAPYIFRTMHIPTYRFDTLTCFWNTEKAKTFSAYKDEKNYFYTLSWSVFSQSELVERKLAENVVIIYTNDTFSNEVQEYVSKDLEEKGHKIVRILLDDLIKSEGSTVCSRVYSFDQRMFLSQIEGSVSETSLLYLASLHDPIEPLSIRESIRRGISGVFQTYSLFSSFKTKLSDFICIGNNGDDVMNDGEPIDPYNGALYEFVNGLQADQIGETRIFRNIDIARNTDKVLLNHLLECGDGGAICSLRGTQIYRQTITETGKQQKPILRKGGIYIVSGGTSENALHVCKVISEKYQGVFYLLSRHLEPYSENPRLLQVISEIENNSGMIRPVYCDVSSEESVSSTINAICLETGSVINGVIHAAGIESKGMIRNKTEAEILVTLAPKVFGIINLHYYTKNYHPDFFLSFSSLSALLPSPGQADYAYANRFIDLYNRIMQKDYAHAFSINWPAFQDAGMAVRNQVDFDNMGLPPLTFRQIEDVFLSALSYKSNHIIPTNRPLTNQEKRKEILAEKRLVSTCDTSKATIRFENMTETQNTIANIWYKYLGHENIGLDDDFTTLGGNSLKMIYVVSAIEKEFQISLNEDLVIDLPTIREIAAHIEEGKTTQSIILEGIEPFNNFFFINCFFNAVFSVLCYFKYPISRLIRHCHVQFLCDKTGFSLEYGYQECWQDILKDIDLKLVVKSSQVDLVQEITENLSHKYPVIISVDCFYLPFRHDAYQKQHFFHSLLVYGYEGNAQLFHIIDQVNVESLSYQKRTISVQDLQKAYNGYLENFSEEKTPPIAVIYPIENGVKSQSKVAERPSSTQSILFLKQIHEKVQRFVEFSDISKETYLKMLNQCIHYFNTEVYVNNELYKDKDFGFLLARLLQIYKHTRASFIKETLAGKDGCNALRNLFISE